MSRMASSLPVRTDAEDESDAIGIVIEHLDTCVQALEMINDKRYIRQRMAIQDIVYSLDQSKPN